MALQSSSAVLSGFLDYLKIEKRMSALTISAYNSYLCQFSEFLEKRERSILKAQRTDVRKFLQQLFSHQVDGRSVGRKLSALRHLYLDLLLEKKIDHDPTLDIESPRQWKVLPKALARDEMEATLAAPVARKAVGPGNEKQAADLILRDRAMLEVFYAGALRVSEMTGAKLEDLKLDAGYLMVRGKGDKERVAPLGNSAQDSLRAYLAQSRPVLTARKGNTLTITGSPWLFVARGGGKLTRQR